MCCQTDLKKAGIYSPQDLIKFPWDKVEASEEILSDEDIQELKNKIREENERLQRERAKDGVH